MTEVIEKKSKWDKVFKVGVIFFTFLLLLVGIAYAFTDVGPAAANYNKNLAAAKSVGLCFNSADVAKYYRVADNDNGALLLDDFVFQMKAMQKEVDYSESSTTDAEFLKIWPKLEAFLPILKQAVEKPHFVFRRKMNTPWDYPPGPGRVMIFVTRAMRRVKIAGIRNEKDVAIDLLTLCAKLASLLDEEPETYSIVKRTSTSGKVEMTIRDLIPTHGRDPSWQEGFGNVLGLLEKQFDVKTSVRVEHWSLIRRAEIMMGRGDLTELGFKSEDSTPTVTMFSKIIPRFKSANISRLNELRAKLVESIPEDKEDIVGLKKALSDYDNNMWAHEPQDLSYRYLLEGYSETRGLGEGIEVDICRRNTLRQALALLARKADPSKGLPLSGRLAIDVGGGKIQMAHLNKGWIVYSIGRNLRDEHTSLNSYSDDFVVHLSTATVPQPPPIKPPPPVTKVITRRHDGIVREVSP